MVYFIYRLYYERYYIYYSKLIRAKLLHLFAGGLACLIPKNFKIAQLSFYKHYSCC